MISCSIVPWTSSATKVKFGWSNNSIDDVIFGNNRIAGPQFAKFRSDVGDEVIENDNKKSADPEADLPRLFILSSISAATQNDKEARIDKTDGQLQLCVGLWSLEEWS